MQKGGQKRIGFGMSSMDEEEFFKHVKPLYDKLSSIDDIKENRLSREYYRKLIRQLKNEYKQGLI